MQIKKKGGHCWERSVTHPFKQFHMIRVEPREILSHHIQTVWSSKNLLCSVFAPHVNLKNTLNYFNHQDDCYFSEVKCSFCSFSVCFVQNGTDSLQSSRCLCSLQKEVKDVFTAITFEVAYSLGKHVMTGHQQRELPALTPVLRWRKGNKIAVKNEVQQFSIIDSKDSYSVKDKFKGIGHTDGTIKVNYCVSYSRFISKMSRQFA